MSGNSYKKTTKELNPVLFTHSAEERVVYEVQREVAKIGELRYDMTTILPGAIGRELPKTFGHYHPEKTKGVRYPEIYEVLEGQALYLIQRPSTKNPKVIEEVYLVETSENEKAVIPPNFGHVTINPKNIKLEMANWCGDFDNDYTTYENLHGACYYLIESKNKKEIEFHKNSYYEEIPELIKVKPREIPELGIIWEKPMIEMKNSPKKLEFLVEPEKYLSLLKPEICFQEI